MESRKNWSAAFGSATSKHEDVVYNIRPDVAEAFIAAIRNQRNVQGPRHAQDFNDLTDTIAQASHIIQHMEAFREMAIVAADSTSAHADRKAIAIAAAMPPSRLYRVLEKFGRPRDRKAAANNPTSPAAKAMRDLADTLSMTPKESAARAQLTRATDDATEPDGQAPRCVIQPCGLPRPEALVYRGDGRDPLPACELHAGWLLAAFPGATVESNPDAPPARGDRFDLDLDIVRNMARGLTEEHEKIHDGTWACPLCDPARLPSQ